ncbi:hypothetical protein ACHAPI_002196 [Fusarium lateritium]
MFDPPVVEISDDSSDDAPDGLVEDNEELLQVLDSIQSTGKIATFSRYSAFVNPGLTIEGNHLIPLPFKEDDAQAIKSVCRQAPFGHGDKTVVDTSVRNTWELDSSKFELANSQWSIFFDVILRDTAKGLGFQKVVAKPHKLLLYEPGSFFKSHKDSEKEQGMIGTLVVCLPSQHEGSDVHLSFGSQAISYSTAPTSKFDLTSISWFSDVTHKVTTLISGYRLVLTYKLFVVGEDPLSASTILEQTDHLKTMLNKWQTQSLGVGKVIYPLDHLYTESSLCLENLKGRDRAVAHTLSQICSGAGFYLLLAHATHVQNGDDGYGAYGDDSEEHETTLSAMYAPNGGSVASNVSIDVDEILGYSISKEEPDSEDEGEYTGNENAPPTFRYHKTVIVLVPKPRLRHYLNKNSSIYNESPKAENECLAEMVLQDLKTARDIVTEFDAFCALFRTSTDHQPLLKSFNAWADPVCEEKLKAQSQWAKSDREYILGTLKTRNSNDEWILQIFLPAIIPRALRYLLWDILHLISLERTSAFPNSRQLYKVIIQHGGQQLCLSETDLTPNAQEDKDEGCGFRTPCQKFVRMLDEGYINGAGQETLALLEQSCNILIERKKLWASVSPQYLRRDFLEPLIKTLETHNIPPVPAVQGFFEVALRDIFHKPINTRPVHLPGWAHQERGCSRSTHCGECRQMNDFLKSPEQQQWHYMAGKPSREHVEAQLRDPVYSFETLKHRSPHTLVVTKRGTNYDIAIRAWKEAFRAVDDSVYWIRNDYLKGFMGEEKYKELFLLEKPGQEDLRSSVTLSWPGRGDMAPPSAKRTRLW